MGKIIVNSQDKSTTIRLKEKTKRMLESKAKNKETHEEIILRLIKMADTLSSNQGTEIMQKGNVIRTEYERLHKTFDITLDNQKYLVVGSYNNLAPIALLRGKKSEPAIDWEINLDIVNINKGKGWRDPSNLTRDEQDNIYFICLKQILEETFDIQIYQLVNIADYLNLDRWEDTYRKYNLSRDSLNTDIKKKLR